MGDKMTSDTALFHMLNAASKPNNGLALEQIGDAMAKVPDDVLAARLREAGFTIEAPQESPLDLDQMEAAENHEDWWKGEAPC